MSFKKKFLAVAAVSALTVATAVPAMALENEFHGLYRMRAIGSNYDDSGAGTLLPSYNPGTKNYIEQRARLLYSAKASDDLKLITHFEIDSRWGDSSYNAVGSRNGGGAIGADQVNLETKNVYLDFNIPTTPLNFKVGIQGFQDAYKGIIFNNDAAGVVATAKLTDATVSLAYFRFNDGQVVSTTDPGSTTAPGSTTSSVVSKGNPTAGAATRDFVTLDGKYNINKDTKVGATYFLLYDDRQTKELGQLGKTNVHIVGVNAATVVGPATLDGFVLYQTGKIFTGQKVSAFAANVGGKVTAGPGALRANVLYISGADKTSPDDASTRHDFQTLIEKSNSAGHAFYPGEMLIMLRSKYATGGTDRAIVYDLNNSSQGLIGGFLGYDLNIGKFFVYSNAGFAMVAKDTAGTHESDYMGTELNTEIGYKIFDNLAASVQGAYVVLGDYFKPRAVGAGNPNDPYTARLMLTYTF